MTWIYLLQSLLVLSLLPQDWFVAGFVICHCNSEKCAQDNFKCRTDTFCFSKLLRARPLEVLNSTTYLYEQSFFTEETGCIPRGSQSRLHRRCLGTLDEAVFNVTLKEYSLIDAEAEKKPILKCCRDNNCNKREKFVFTFTEESRTSKKSSGGLFDTNFFYINGYTVGAMSLSVLVTAVILLQLGILCGRRLSLKKYHQDSNETLNCSIRKGQSVMSHDLKNCSACGGSNELKIDSSLNYPTMSCRSCDSSKQTNSDRQILLSTCHQGLIHPGTDVSSLPHSDKPNDIQVLPLATASAHCGRKILPFGYLNSDQSSFTPSGPFTRSIIAQGGQLQHFHSTNSSSVNTPNTRLPNPMIPDHGIHYPDSLDNCQPYAEGQLTTVYQTIKQNEYMDPNYSQTPVDRFNNYSVNNNGFPNGPRGQLPNPPPAYQMVGDSDNNINSAMTNSSLIMNYDLSSS